MEDGGWRFSILDSLSSILGGLIECHGLINIAGKTKTTNAFDTFPRTWEDRGCRCYRIGNRNTLKGMPVTGNCSRYRFPILSLIPCHVLFALSQSGCWHSRILP